MSAFDTKYLIAKTFIDLCEESSIRKVSISDIIKKTGKNRKTFYYHFVDKNSLIMWIFRYDLGKKLKERFPESMLVYEEPSDDSKSAFPYYILKKSGVRSLNHSAFFECFASVLEDRRRFYNQALLENGPQSLRNYLYDLYLPAMVNAPKSATMRASTPASFKSSRCSGRRTISSFRGMVLMVQWTRTPWLWAKRTASRSSSGVKFPAKARIPKSVPAR